jgi:hypothetical protein
MGLQLDGMGTCQGHWSVGGPEKMVGALPHILKRNAVVTSQVESKMYAVDSKAGMFLTFFLERSGQCHCHPWTCFQGAILGLASKELKI